MGTAGQVQQYRTITLATTVLANDGVTQLVKLSSQGAWRQLQLFLNATTTGGSPSGLSLYEGWGVLSRIRLRFNSAILWDIIPGEEYKRAQYRNSSRPSSTPASTTPGYWAYSLQIPFILPDPFSFPADHCTMAPAGICANIEMEFVVAATRIGGLYSTVSSTSFSVNPTIVIQATQADVSNAELSALVANNSLAAYELHTVTQPLTATGLIEIPLLTGSGIMVDMYASHQSATVPVFATDTSATAMVSTFDLVSGTNDFLLNSTYLCFQAQCMSFSYAPDPVVFTGLNVLGSWYHVFAQNGAIGEGVDLNGLQQLRYRPVIAVLTNNTGTVNVEQGIFRPGFWRQVANL